MTSQNAEADHKKSLSDAFALPRARPPLLHVTEAAKARIRTLLNKREVPSKGIRIGIKTKGCSGMQYTIAYADEKGPLDEEVVCDELHIFIDARAVMFLLGTSMDFVSDTMQSGFVFENPNEKGKCGCGKSFHV